MAYNKKEIFSESDQKLATIGKVLSHPARVRILRILAEKQSCICGEIVEGLPLAQSTVSQHLKELKGAGIIKGEIDGPRSCYCIDWDKWAELENELKLILEDMHNFKTDLNCC
ncbi:MAG: metalloregulator ArsR/SmtB family transcription factor [Vicingaceae bacterium]